MAKEKRNFDFIIIGAGAAGLSAAQYGARSGLSTLVIDFSTGGGQALNIFKLENYPGLFPSVKGGDLIENMKAQAEKFGSKIVQCHVTSIDKIASEYIVKTDNGNYTSYSLLIATGAEHRKLGVPGEREFSGAGVSYCATCDGPFFKNKKIVVVGGGDSACDEAFYLSSLSDSVLLVHRRHQLRAQKAVQEKVLNNDHITVRYNTVVKEIKGERKVKSIVLEDVENHDVTELPCDAVFVFVGMNPRTALVDMLPKDEMGYLKTNENMETAMPGLYAAGDVRSKPFRQLITAASDGAIAAHAAQEFVRTQKRSER